MQYDFNGNKRTPKIRKLASDVAELLTAYFAERRFPEMVGEYDVLVAPVLHTPVF